MLRGGILAKLDLGMESRSEIADDPHQYYLTKRGLNVFVPRGAEIGHVLHLARALDDHGKVEFELDEVVAHANATSFED